jgi:hypothetical protein
MTISRGDVPLRASDEQEHAPTENYDAEDDAKRSGVVGAGEYEQRTYGYQDKPAKQHRLVRCPSSS